MKSKIYSAKAGLVAILLGISFGCFDNNVKPNEISSGNVNCSEDCDKTDTQDSCVGEESFISEFPDTSEFMDCRYEFLGNIFLYGDNQHPRWDNVTQELGFYYQSGSNRRNMDCFAFSAGDFNNDSYPDLAVGGLFETCPIDIWINEYTDNGKRSFRNLGLIRSDRDAPTRAVFASYTGDINNDNRPEIFFAGEDGLYVLYFNDEADFRFERIMQNPNPESNFSSMALSYIDDVLVLYATRLASGAELNQSYPNASNLLIQTNQDGSYENITDQVTSLLSGGMYHTFTVGVADISHKDLMYVLYGNDIAPDYFYKYVTRNSFEEILLPNPPGWQNVDTMGVSFSLDGRGLNMLRTDNGRIVGNKINFSDESITDFTYDINFEDPRISWGIESLYANNDLNLDAIVTNSKQANYNNPHLDDNSLNLSYLEGHDGTIFDELNSEAGEEFDGTKRFGSYSVASFDYDLDGYPDLAVGPMPFNPTNDQGLMILKHNGNLRGKRIGFRLPYNVNVVGLKLKDKNGNSCIHYHLIPNGEGPASNGDNHLVSFGLEEKIVEGIYMWGKNRDGAIIKYKIEGEIVDGNYYKINCSN